MRGCTSLKQGCVMTRVVVGGGGRGGGLQSADHPPALVLLSRRVCFNFSVRDLGFMAAVAVENAVAAVAAMTAGDVMWLWVWARVRSRPCTVPAMRDVSRVCTRTRHATAARRTLWAGCDRHCSTTGSREPTRGRALPS
jgi:hypothetical protein